MVLKALLIRNRIIFVAKKKKNDLDKSTEKCIRMDLMNSLQMNNITRFFRQKNFLRLKQIAIYFYQILEKMYQHLQKYDEYE